MAHIVEFITYRVVNYMKTISTMIRNGEMETYYCEILKVYLK